MATSSPLPAWTSATVRAVLAADLTCDEADLLGEGVRVVLAEERPGRRRFPRGPRVLIVATMGVGAVVSCDASRLEWARTELGRLDRNQLFTAATLARIAARVEEDGQMLAGPDLKFVCAEGDLRPAAPAGVEIEVVDGLAVAELYRQHDFRHALSYLTGSPRPDMLAAVARIAGAAGSSTAGVVGVAGASADCEELWQIGVDSWRASAGAGSAGRWSAGSPPRCSPAGTCPTTRRPSRTSARAAWRSGSATGWPGSSCTPRPRGRTYSSPTGQG